MSREASNPEQGADDTGDPAESPYWQMTVGIDGVLTATLTGTHPPLTVSAHDLSTLRKRIKNLIFRALL